MFSQNIIVGNLGAAPELRFTQAGVGVLNMNICSVEKWLSDGEWKEKIEWHRIVIFGKNAEHYAKKLGKGDMVLCVGMNKTRSWEDKDGNKRYTTEVHVRTCRRLVNRATGPVPAEEVPPTPEPAMGDDVPF